ncbi:MAG: hypothetical protein R3C59_25150 [Planctomycetaceae bacterium]
MYDYVTKTIKNWMTPQKRRKSFHTAPALIDTLEPRQLLTVPGVINITNAQIGESPDFLHRPIIADWESDVSAESDEYWISDGRDNNNLFRRPYVGTVTENHLEFVGMTTYAGFEARVWVRGVNGDGTGPRSALARVVVPDGVVPGTPEDVRFSDNDPETPSDSKSFYTPAASDLVFNIDSARSSTQNTDTQDMDAWVTRDGEILSTQGAYVSTSDGTTRTRFRFDYDVDSGQNIPDGLYRVWFRARNGVGESPWTEPVTIGVGASQPEITGPPANGQPARPEITWSPGVAGVDYHIWIQTEDGTVVTSQTGISGTSFHPDTDLADGIYFAYSTDGFGLPWSSPFQFQVGNSTLPQRPQLTMIPNNLGDDTEDFRPLFQWTADPNALRYDLYVSDGFSGAAIIRETELTGATFLGPVLGTNGSVRSRAWLRAFGSDGTVTMWSEFVEFQVFSDGRVLPVGS